MISYQLSQEMTILTMTIVSRHDYHRHRLTGGGKHGGSSCSLLPTPNKIIGGASCK